MIIRIDLKIEMRAKNPEKALEKLKIESNGKDPLEVIDAELDNFANDLKESFEADSDEDFLVTVKSDCRRVTDEIS